MKVAVIGLGAMGKNHVRVYSTLDNVELVGVCDVDNETSKKIGQKYKVNHYTRYEDLFKQEKIDAVSICVPTTLHKEVSLYFLKRRINVLLEKPIAATIEEAKKIIEEAEKNKVTLMIGHIERFNPSIIELKKQIDAGKLGRVFKIDVNRIGPFPSRIRDVGVIIDLAVHDLDIMRYLTESEVDCVYSLTEKRIHTSNEDLLSGLIRFKDRTIGQLNINWLTPTKIRKLYITGEKGMFVADYLKQDLYYYENEEINNDISYADILRGVTEGKMIKFPVKKREPLLAEIEHFLDCVLNNKKPLVGGKEGLKAIELALRLIKSSEEGRAI